MNIPYYFYVLIYKMDDLRYLFPEINPVLSSLPFIVYTRRINTIPNTNAPSEKKRVKLIKKTNSTTFIIPYSQGLQFIIYERPTL